MAPTLANLAAGTNMLGFTTSLRDDLPDPGAPSPIPQVPHWENSYFGQVSAPPAPTYPPSTGYTADPNFYGNEGTSAPAKVPVKDPGRYLSRPSTYNFDLSRGGAGKTSHRASDVLVSAPPVSPALPAGTYPACFIWPIYAKDQTVLSLDDAQIAALTSLESESLGIGLIRSFDGTQWLRDQDIKLQAKIDAGLSTPVLHFDSNLPSSLVAANGLWLPAFDEENPPATRGFSGLVPFPDKLPKGRGATAVAGVDTGSGNLWNFTIPSSDPRVVSVSNLGFFFTVTPSQPADQQPLYAARLDIAAGAAVPPDWYRRVRPFSFEIHDVKLQRGAVTILNNVIDPTRGETARLSYQLGQAGPVTITVFTLDGDVVRRLVVGTQNAGDYSTAWDGRNLSGDAVARGIYFVRVVAPGIDEIRKVLVVRK